MTITINNGHDDNRRARSTRERARVVNSQLEDVFVRVVNIVEETTGEVEEKRRLRCRINANLKVSRIVSDYAELSVIADVDLIAYVVAVVDGEANELGDRLSVAANGGRAIRWQVE